MTKWLSESWYIFTGIGGALLVLALHLYAARHPHTRIASQWQRLGYAAYACAPVFGVLVLTDAALSLWAPDYTFHHYFLSPYFFPAIYIACWLAAPYFKRRVPLDLGSPDAPDHNSKADAGSLLVFFLVFGLFLVAAYLATSEEGMERAAGALLIACGLLSMILSRVMSAAQHRLAESRFAPASLKNVRPLTFTLWGACIAIVGVLWFFQPAQA